MSKFFIQLLLSLFIGVSALASFKPEVRAQGKQALAEARALVRQTTGIAFTSAYGALSQVRASMTGRLDNSVSTSTRTKADLRTRGSANLPEIYSSSLLGRTAPQMSVQGSATVTAETEKGAALQDATIHLKNKSASTLNLRLDPLR